MTYQFDPRPDGLHYEPFSAPGCTKTLWLLRDPAPEPWIDLRSVFEALGMSWRTWQMYCRGRQRQWNLEACYDHRRRETLLLPGDRMPAVLGDVANHLRAHGAPQRRVRALHQAWRGIYAGLQGREVHQARLGPAAGRPKSGRPRRRKIDAYVVRQVFLLAQKAEPKRRIANALRISVRAVRAVAAGTYPLDPEGMAAWSATFGRPDLAPSAFIAACKRADRGVRSTTACPPASNGSCARFSGTTRIEREFHQEGPSE